jgi:hypothetical protein
VRATFPLSAWVGRGITVVVVLAISAVAAPAFCASTAVLFPKPLHLVRTIEDPLARGASTVHEYCAGNQVITVSGSRVAIADYDKQQLTEIDREAGTYSVTPFTEIAKSSAETQRRPRAAAAQAATAAKTPKPDTWKATALGTRAAATGRSLDSWELVHGEARERTTIQLGIDRRIALSRDAVEVLVGAAYPHARREEHDALLRAASGPAADHRQPGANSAAAQSPAEYGLPVEQVITFESQGEHVTVRNTVREVNEDLPPPELLIIPPGSQLVESRIARLARELREADELPGQTNKQAPHP